MTIIKRVVETPGQREAKHYRICLEASRRQGLADLSRARYSLAAVTTGNLVLAEYGLRYVIERHGVRMWWCKDGSRLQRKKRYTCACEGLPQNSWAMNDIEAL